MNDFDLENFRAEVDKVFLGSISTVDESGKRVWLYPRNAVGKLTRYRTVVAWILIGLMVAAPFIEVNGSPLLLFNVFERKFILFGKIFWPQDFQIFLLIMMAGMVFIGLFTVVYGRVFCGWVCPQTIFMESVFRKIEYWIEGDYKVRHALDKGPLNAKKVFKKTLKHIVFLLISYVIANIFLSYIIGVKEVMTIWSNPMAKPSALISFVVFTLIFYWVFARFREQVCTTVCPYGRLQGVLQDKNTLMVIYDYMRGEKRAFWRAKENRVEARKGDCIDCGHCVTVCPMGIDIRNGTQLECTNCTACMDACDYIMRKTGQPEGLIRIDSESGVAEKKAFKFSFRIVGYSAVLFVLMAIIVALLAFRTDVQTTILRTPGVSYQILPDDKVSNLYNIKLINKTSHEITVDIKLLDIPGQVDLVGKSLIVPSQGKAETVAFIILEKSEIQQLKTKLSLGVFSNDQKLETIKTTFIGPLNTEL
jgi:cytochrome c oxidase accessory protein FixG